MKHRLRTKATFPVYYLEKNGEFSRRRGFCIEATVYFLKKCKKKCRFGTGDILDFKKGHNKKACPIS